MAPTIENDQGAERGHLLPKAKVLVVHEDPRLLVYYCHIFEELGLEVLTVANYAAGLACLDREVLGLIVVSQGSRAFEGRCCIVERAIEIDRHTQVIVVARCRDLGKYLEAMQLGAVDYPEEPVTVAEMGRLVTTHLRAPSSPT